METQMESWSRPIRSMLTLAAGVFLIACDRQPGVMTPSDAGAPPAVSVATPVLKEIVEWDEYTARLDAVEEVEIRARISGYLETVLFQEGAMVTEGDLLFLIDPRPFEAELRQRVAELNQAEAAAANARAQFRRAQRLRETNSISEEEYQIRSTASLGADADVQSAQAAVDVAQLNLQYTEVRAPISGRISRPFVTEGNLVHGGTGDAALLTRIVSLDPIHAYFEASERAYLKYVRLSRSGQRPSSRDARNPVFLRLADEDGFSHRGYMDFVDNLLDPNTGTMTGRALVANPDGLLAPGMFARLRLPGSGIQESLLIPDAAIGSDQTQKFVYVVGDGDLVSYRAIEIGPIVHGLRVVRRGLGPDDRIVVSGLQRVRPGAAVAPEPGEIEWTPEPLTPADAAPVASIIGDDGR